jgi:AcrR family transcriptional regulator
MARTQAADYEQRREAIMEKAADLFAKVGFNGASVSELASACGVSKSLLYHYYDSKEAVLHEVMSSHIEMLSADVAFVMNMKEGALARLRELVHRFMQHYVGAANRQKVLLNELANLPEEDRRMVVSTQRKLIEAVQSLLVEIHPSLAGDPVRARVETMLLFGMINWTHTWFDPTGPISARELADMVLERIEQKLTLPARS